MHVLCKKAKSLKLTTLPNIHNKILQEKSLKICTPFCTTKHRFNKRFSEMVNLTIDFIEQKSSHHDVFCKKVGKIDDTTKNDKKRNPK